jgi:hypothetical protein
MANTYKVLGQSNPTATTDTDLYTVQGGTMVVISSLVVCNRSGTATSFRIAIRPGGATIADEHYLYYDLPLDSNDTFVATIGVTLYETDVIAVYATDATLSFAAFGQEFTI